MNATLSLFLCSNSAVQFGSGRVDATEATAAAAEELDNPEGEDKGTVLLHGPGVVGELGKVSGGVASPDLAEGAELACGSESVDSDGDPGAEVGAAEAGQAAAGDASKHRLVDTDANTNSGEEDDKKNCTHAGVDVRPARSSLLAVSITVFREVSKELSSSLNIAVGSTAASVIDDVVKVCGRASKSGGELVGSILGSDLHDVSRVESGEVKSAENEGADSDADSLSKDHLLVLFSLSRDHGLSSLGREHHLHFIHLQRGFCGDFNNYKVSTQNRLNSLRFGEISILIGIKINFLSASAQQLLRSIYLNNTHSK